MMWGWKLNLSYYLFGPTVVHLYHELYLSISLVLLVYGSIRDMKYTLLAGIWLSRTLLLRWIVVGHDRWTSVHERSIPLLSPGRYQLNPIETVIDFIASVVLAGQIFDRPSPWYVANYLGTTNPHTYNTASATDSLIVNNDLASSSISSNSRHNRRGNNRQQQYNSYNSYNNNNHNNATTSIVSYVYVLDRLDRLSSWFQMKFYEFKNALPSSIAVATSEAYWTRLVTMYTPELQMVLPLVTLIILYSCKNMFQSYAEPLSSSSSTTAAAATTTAGGTNDDFAMNNSNLAQTFIRYFTSIYSDVAYYLLKDIQYILYGTSMASTVDYLDSSNNYGTSVGGGGGSDGLPFVTNHALNMEVSQTSSSMVYAGGYLHDSTKPFGLYQRSYPPTYVECFYYMIVPATLLGILLFGRVILLPLPDLVAGPSNVVKQLREYTKKQVTFSSFGSSGNSVSGSLSGDSGSGSGHTGNKTGHYRNSSSKGGGGGSGIPSFSDTQLERSGSHKPWLERYQSIVQDHRFNLISKITFIRLVENLFICAILPRTEFACKTTGQCDKYQGRNKLSKVMFFQGITAPLRDDFYTKNNSYNSFNEGGGSSVYYKNSEPYAVGENILRVDTIPACMIGISVIVITISILLVQAATLNRSHLGITGYLAGGWIVVDDGDLNNKSSSLESEERKDGKQSSSSDHNHNRNNKSQSHQHQQQQQQQPLEWEPRKRYKKGDIIKYGQTLYKATTNNPEGIPHDLLLRLTYRLFRNELGHPATSRLVAFVTSVQFALISLLILMILTYQLVLQVDNCTAPLLWTLAANLVAVYGTVSVSVPNYNEFDHLAKSIFD